MNNFKFLNIPTPLFAEGITLNDIPKTNISKISKEKFINKEIFDLLDQLDLKILFVETFCKKPGGQEAIHIDGSGGDYTKLNWVFGGGDSEMVWYKPIDLTPKKPALTDTNTLYYSYDRSEVEEIERTVIKNPTLVQVGVPHDIVNVTKGRLCVSVVIHHKTKLRRPTMQESIELLKKYINGNE